MEAQTLPPRGPLLGSTIRRLLRRGARGKISKALARMRPEDVALMLRDYTPAEQLNLFRILLEDYPEATTTVLTELEQPQRVGLLEALGPEDTARQLENAPVDDAVYLLDSMPKDFKEKVLEIVDLEEKLSVVQEHMAYRDESAGRIMDTEYVALEEGMTVGEAIGEIRKIARDVDMISYLYVINPNGYLTGVVPLRTLLLAEPASNLGEVMNTSVVKVDTDTDQEEVAQLAARYDLLAIPVVDGDNKLVGIVTIDDILDIFKEEATEDFYKMAGTSDDELVYQEQSLRVMGIRLPWILFNLVGLLLAGWLTTRFEGSFESLSILIGFIPVIMGMAGNVGSQTSTIAVRGLATGRLHLGEEGVRRFIWQQVKVGALLGLACALVVGIVASLSYRGQVVSSARLAVAVGAALFLTIQLASLNGALIPMVFKRLGFDPAVASGPLVTTLNDVLGILMYFGLATVFFHGLAA